MIKYQDVEQLHIELSSYCNSSCPTCPRNIDGGIVSTDLVANSMSESDFKTMISVDFLKQIKSINMCGNYGDPMMCKDFLSILRYIKNSNSECILAIHTNGGIRSESFWTEIGKLNAEMPNMLIVFSIDGLEDTNHLYRIGVNWDKLMRNVSAFISAGGKAIWDFLVFKHNEHQLVQAENLAAQMGFSRFIKAKPHGFKYNGKMRVVDSRGKFLRHIEQSSEFETSSEGNNFDTIDFDIDIEQIKNNYSILRQRVYDTGSNLYLDQLEKFQQMDSLLIKNCTAVESKEIYVDSKGNVHPCCYLGHIGQDSLPIAELVYHKKWIDDTVGLANINALNKPIKEIMESYFDLIEQSWTKTFLQGRNPMCAFKCGYQRQQGLIRL